MCLKDADEMAKSVDPDQTTFVGAVGAVWSGSALFAYNPSLRKLRNVTVTDICPSSELVVEGE